MEEFKEEICAFEKYLCCEEKSAATMEKYLRDVRYFCGSVKDGRITKEGVMEHKRELSERFQAASVNSHLSAVNCFLRFMGKEDCCVKLLKIQRQMFAAEEREMTLEEYHCLVQAAGETRLGYIIQTICGTGIRVSELQYITAEALERGKAVIECKNKMRTIFIPKQVQELLEKYRKENHITEGCIFITRSGKPVNRSNIWKQMKVLCEKVHIPPEKVFPHRNMPVALYHGSRLLLRSAGAAGAAGEGAGAAREPAEDGRREAADKIFLRALYAHKRQLWKDKEPLVP